MRAFRRDRAHRTGAYDTGMTLVEMLVVLAIIGITSAVAVLSMNFDRRLNTRVAAQRMQAQIQLAADETMISDRQMAITVGPHAYRFVERAQTDSEWQPSSVPQLFDAFTLPEGVNMTVDEAVIPLGANGGGRPFVIRLSGEGGKWTLAFDGMTARVFPSEAETAGSS